MILETVAMCNFYENKQSSHNQVQNHKKQRFSKKERLFEHEEQVGDSVLAVNIN